MRECCLTLNLLLVSVRGLAKSSGGDFSIHALGTVWAVSAWPVAFRRKPGSRFLRMVLKADCDDHPAW